MSYINGDVAIATGVSVDTATTLTLPLDDAARAGAKPTLHATTLAPLQSPRCRTENAAASVAITSL